MGYHDIYTTESGDMWDGIAYKVYGHERFVRELMLANPGERQTVIFGAGVEIVCPDVDPEMASPLPPWKRL